MNSQLKSMCELVAAGIRPMQDVEIEKTKKQIKAFHKHLSDAFKKEFNSIAPMKYDVGRVAAMEAIATLDRMVH